MATPFQRRHAAPVKELRAAEHPENRAGASGAPALRAGGTIQSACARWRLGPLESAERSLVATRVHAGAGCAPTLAEQPRLDSNRLARTNRLSTSRKRPGCRASEREHRTDRESHDPSPERDSRAPSFRVESHAVLTHHAAPGRSITRPIVACTTNGAVPRRLDNLQRTKRSQIGRAHV